VICPILSSLHRAEGQAADELFLAEPAHEAGEGNAWHPVCQEKIQIFLQQQAISPCGKRCRQPAPRVRGG
jgi:hypothetical protein